MRELMNAIHPVPVLPPAAAAITDNTAQVGAIVDQGDYRSATYIIATGTLADAGATFTVLLEHGDAADLSDAEAVDDEDLVGTEVKASFNQGDDGECFKLGYVGLKRYHRLTITPAGNGAAAPMAVVCIL